MSSKTKATSGTIVTTHGDYHRLCWQLLQAGRRPTADDLVERLRGSKSTAVKAINEFWSTWLPTRIGSFKESPPDEVAHAAKEFWAIAKSFADDRAAENHADAKKKLDDELKSLELNKSSHELAHAQLLKDQQALAGELSALRMKLMQTELLLTDAKRERDHAEQDRRKANEKAADALSEVAKVKHELEVQHAKYTKFQIDQHEERTKLHEIASSLKDVYHTSEQKLRVELDAARTAHRNGGKVHQRVVTLLEAKIERLQKYQPTKTSVKKKAKKITK